MIFEHNNKNYVINCDWLQYSVLLCEDNPTLSCPEGWRVEQVQGNNIFRHRALIYDGMGRKWLTLLWSPYSSRLNARIMTVQAANFLLYESAIHQSYNLLMDIVPCGFNSMGRVDLCCDFMADDDFIRKIETLNNGTTYIQGKHEGSTWWHEINAGNGYYAKQPHCLTFGSPTSEIKLKIYNKSRELGLVGGRKKQQSDVDIYAGVPQEEIDGHKPYIVSEWRQAKFDIRKVWRMEFSLSGAGQLRSNNQALTLDDVASSYWQLQTFLGLYNTRAICRQNQGSRHGHHNDDAIFRLLDLPKDGHTLKWFAGNPPTPCNTDAIPIVRTMLNKIIEPCIITNETVYMAYAGSIIALVEQNRLDNWFRNRFGDDCEPFLQELFQCAGTKLIEDFADPKKLFN